jgi:hypothetical protein
MINADHNKQEPSSLFEPFSWFAHPERKYTPEFVETVHDITAGVSQALKMVEQSDCASGKAETPLLSPFHIGVFMRMSIAALDLLHDAAAKQICDRNRRSRK